jgi:uncharacterized repeat protein (TIGR03803 family)
MPIKRNSDGLGKRNWNKAYAVVALGAIAGMTLPAQTFTSLASFNKTDGANPHAGLVQAIDGNLYGATYYGGANLDGAIFRITPAGTLTVAYSMCAQNDPDCDAIFPQAGLIQATDGNLYGTTESTIYKMTPSGTLTELYYFCIQAGCAQGPTAPLLQAADGDFYGTTMLGGANGSGTVFKFTAAGGLTILHSFNGADGTSPESPLIQVANGDFYGTTTYGGANGVAGTIFKITPTGTLTTIYSFCQQNGCTDGSSPYGGLVQAANGDFYGTTSAGGVASYGTVFKVTPSGALTTLHSFGTPSPRLDGTGPSAGLVLGTDGNFYGTTTDGGSSGLGTIFKITAKGQLTTLHSFSGADGEIPYAGLVQDTNGEFYGTTYGGGRNFGSVFSLAMGLGPFVKTLTVSGEVGVAVTILGTNLTGATSVTFNGIAATFEVVSSSEITTTVPNGATSGMIQVVTPDGALSSNVPFRVT